MSRKRTFGLVVVVALVVSLLGSIQPVQARESLCVRPGGDEDCYASIQAAVDAAAPGDIVVVKKGTYVEQVVIDGKDLTLDAEDDATVRAPATLEQTLLPFFEDRSIITVKNATVTVRDFVIDGANSGETNRYLAGISYFNAGGTIKKNKVRNIAFASGPFFDPQLGYEGFAIQAFNFEATPRKISITQNTVTNFNSDGIIVVSDPNPDDFTQSSYEVTISKNRVVGSGPTAVLDQYALLAFNVSGEISDNNISDIFNTNFDPAGSDFGPANGIRASVGKSLVIDDNRVRNTQMGLVVHRGTNVVIEDNDIRGSSGRRGYTGLELSGQSTTVEDNDFRNFEIGIHLLNNPDAGTAVDTTLEDNDFRNVITEILNDPGASVAPSPAARNAGHPRRYR